MAPATFGDEKMMRAVMGGLLLAVAFLTKPADAQSNDLRSANYFLPTCRQFIADDKVSSPVLAEGRCVGTIEGLDYLAELLPQEKRSCSPQGATIAQLVRVVVAYIERRPQRMHESFKELTLEALHDAWPCR